jgi:hypothetical protein
MNCSIRKENLPTNAITSEDSKKVIDFVNCFYNGINTYDTNYKKTDSCSYIGTIKSDRQKIIINGGQRSLSEMENRKLASRAKSLSNLLKIKYKEFPLAIAWTPNLKNARLSELLRKYLSKKNKDVCVSYTLGGCEAAKLLSDKNTHYKEGVL